MKFDEIVEESKVYPGEYLLYEPTMEIVLCGAFNREKDIDQVSCRGACCLKIQICKFKKIRLTKKEHKERKHTKCKGCASPK